MLGAGAKPADEQRDHQQAEAGARACEAITDTSECGAERKYGGGTEPFRQKSGGNLKARHGANEDAAQRAKLGIAESEFRLPDWQQDVENIGIAVMQCVRAASNRRRPAFVALGRAHCGASI